MNYFRWNINPDLLHIGDFRIRWYGLFFAVSFLLGYHIMRWIFLKEDKDVDHLDNLLMYLMGGTIIGARLGHCLFYDPSYYLSHPVKILMVWEGGLASHGGAIGVLIGLYLYKRKMPETYLWLLDRVAVPTALVAAFIRIGNLFNSEIIGIPTSVSWAIIFEKRDQLPRHPAQLYESFSYFIIFFLLGFLYKRYADKMNDGALFGTFLTCIFTARFFIEFVKVKQAAYQSTFSLSTGQILSIPFILTGVVLIVRSLKKVDSQKNKP